MGVAWARGGLGWGLGYGRAAAVVVLAQASTRHQRGHEMTKPASGTSKFEGPERASSAKTDNSENRHTAQRTGFCKNRSMNSKRDSHEPLRKSHQPDSAVWLQTLVATTLRLLCIAERLSGRLDSVQNGPSEQANKEPLNDGK